MSSSADESRLGAFKLNILTFWFEHDHVQKKGRSKKAVKFEEFLAQRSVRHR